jgi:hypothetical protein
MLEERTVPVVTGSKYLYIPVSRLVIMSMFTLGLYEAYWIYKNWRYIKERDKLNIQPFWRGIFGVFFCHSLLKAIHDDSEVNNIQKAEFPAAGLATGWVALMILGNIFGRVDSVAANWLGMLIAFPSFLFFVPVQNYINKVNDTIHPRPEYYGWSSGHSVCLVVGILFLLLIIAGLLAES